MTPNPDMQPAVTEALEPCPKCHSENVEFGGHGRGVYCVICKDCCIQTKFYQSRAAVAADWNTRHRSQETARSADIAQRLQDYMEQYHGVCLSASEWDAVAASVMARSADVGRERTFGFLPGNYTNVCIGCGEQFEGAKRSIRCIRCAGDLAAIETDRLTRDLDITNADHIALWIEANTIPDEPMNQCASWLACRIVEAHERALTTPPADEPECSGCGDSGELFGHSPDCDSDLCALAGGMDDCDGQVLPCHCVAPAKPFQGGSR